MKLHRAIALSFLAAAAHLITMIAVIHLEYPQFLWLAAWPHFFGYLIAAVVAWWWPQIKLFCMCPCYRSGNYGSDGDWHCPKCGETRGHCE